MFAIIGISLPEAWDSPKFSLDFHFSEYKGGVEVDYKFAGHLCVRGSGSVYRSTGRLCVSASGSVYRSAGWLCFRGSYPLPLMSKGERML